MQLTGQQAWLLWVAQNSSQLQAAAAAERAAIVAYLRERANDSSATQHGLPMMSPAGRGLLLLMADRIERGEHGS